MDEIICYYRVISFLLILWTHQSPQSHGHKII